MCVDLYLNHYKIIYTGIQLEIGIPTVSLVYLQDNQKYVHIHKSIDYGINIRGKKQIMHKHTQ